MSLSEDPAQPERKKRKEVVCFGMAPWGPAQLQPKESSVSQVDGL